MLKPIPESLFLGNLSTKEVHDLANVLQSPSGCQINEIILAGNAVLFTPDSLAGAAKDGFDPCAKCLPGSKK